MEQFKLGEMEHRFAEIIWSNAPITSGELVKLCETQLQWKKSTTYTMLKRLCTRKIFENNNGTVSVLISKEDFTVAQGKQFITDSFSGSLPQFLTAFTRKNTLSEKDIQELQQLIDNQRKG